MAENISAGLADPETEHTGDGIGMVAAMLNHNQSLDGLCGDVDEPMLDRGFHYQSLAARLHPRFEQWLAARPLLDADHVVDHLDEWTEYRRHASTYFRDSLDSRRAEDLPLLLLVHAPDGYAGLRPPYRVDDPERFLGLLSAADALGMAVPPPLLEEGRRLAERGIQPDPRLRAGWRGDAPEDMASAAVRAMHPETNAAEFCSPG